VRSGCGGNATWLFLRWSGVDGMEGGAEEGASVGEAISEPSGSIEGSKSRSGMGGERSGRRVIRKSTSRRNVLRKRSFHNKRSQEIWRT
jgi:hypothetical protein